MKKANIFLAAVLAALILVMVYFWFGTSLEVDAAAIRDGADVRCDLTLKNGSLFKFEHLELIPIAPDTAELTTDAAGQNVNSLSTQRAMVMLTGAGEDVCKIEIGYYVLGMRKTVNVTIE